MNTRSRDNTPYKAPRTVIAWLFVCAAAVFAMALIGAITRLTESGLSMVEWRPLMGALPPLNEAEWERVFGLYKETPQYRDTFPDMTIGEFKNIFFWEWFHRFWGRMIGVLYAVPFFWFLIRGKLPKDYLPSFFAYLLLGAAQGGMGWYMVKSGLVDMPAVSHYRLAAHLGLAFLIFGLLFHTALRLCWTQRAPGAERLSPLETHVRICLFLTAVTMVWGAFVAGLDAGLLYNSFPMMGDYPWPPEMFDESPFWVNFVENPAAVQFTHRCLAILTGLAVLSFALRSRYFNPPPRARRIFAALAIVVLAQIGLGIATLLTGVDIVYAVAHQGGAMVLLALLIAARHEVPDKKFSYAD